MELYPELNRALLPRALVIVSEEEHIVTNPNDANLVQASTDPGFARERFQRIEPADFVSDRKLRHFFEEAYLILEDFSSALCAEYATLLAAFLERYNLRYRITTPFHLAPTLPGLMTALVDQIEAKSEADEHLRQLKTHLDRAADILSRDGMYEDLPKLIGSACNLVEGLATTASGASSGTLSEIAKQLKIWPHPTVKDALLKLYGFCSDYPGVRHAGNPTGKLRELTHRDGLVLSTLLVAYSGYFADLDFDEIICWNKPTESAPVP
jgi:hypothetical protein